MAKVYETNELMQLRGNPGTHDVQLGSETLKALKAWEEVALPRYDKSAHEGQGDQVGAKIRWILRPSKWFRDMDFNLF